MGICTDTPGGFIRRDQNNDPDRPNYTLWHLSMPEADLNPTAYVEPLLRFNWTRNTFLSRWRAGYKFEKKWVRAMLAGLAVTTNHFSLIPHILASFEQMSMESKFLFLQRPYNNEHISFSTQEHVYPPRSLRYGRTLSITYLVLKEFISELSR